MAEWTPPESDRVASPSGFGHDVMQFFKNGIKQGSTPDAILQSLGQSATLEGGKYVVAAYNSVKYGVPYHMALEDQNKQIEQNKKEHPYATTVGSVVGGAPAAILAGGGGALRAGLKTAALGGTTGALGAESLPDAAAAGTVGAVLGGTVGAAVPGAVRGLGALAGKAAETVGIPTRESVARGLKGYEGMITDAPGVRMSDFARTGLGAGIGGTINYISPVTEFQKEHPVASTVGGALVGGAFGGTTAAKAVADKASNYLSARAVRQFFESTDKQPIQSLGYNPAAVTVPYATSKTGDVLRALSNNMSDNPNNQQEWTPPESDRLRGTTGIRG